MAASLVPADPELSSWHAMKSTLGEPSSREAENENFEPNADAARWSSPNTSLRYFPLTSRSHVSNTPGASLQGDAAAAALADMAALQGPAPSDAAASAPLPSVVGADSTRGRLLIGCSASDGTLRVSCRRSPDDGSIISVLGVFHFSSCSSPLLLLPHV